MLQDFSTLLPEVPLAEVAPLDIRGHPIPHVPTVVLDELVIFFRELGKLVEFLDIFVADTSVDGPNIVHGFLHRQPFLAHGYGDKVVSVFPTALLDVPRIYVLRKKVKAILERT